LIVSDSLDRVGHRNRRDRSIGSGVNCSYHRLMKFTRREGSRCVVHNNYSSVLADDRKRRSNGVGSFGSTSHRNIGSARFDKFGAFTLLTWSENNNNVISSGTAHRKRVINHSIIAKKFVLLWCHAKTTT
jgi:hypothetical protein